MKKTQRRSIVQVSTDENLDNMVSYLIRVEGHDNAPALIRYLIRNRYMQHTKESEVPNRELLRSIEQGEIDYQTGKVTDGFQRLKRSVNKNHEAKRNK